MIKLYKDFDDFEWTTEINELIEEEGLQGVEIGTLELRDGRQVRIIEEDEGEENKYMLVVFDGDYIEEYEFLTSVQEINRFLIKLQKKK